MPNLVMIGTRGWAGRTPSLSPLSVLPFVGIFCLCMASPHRWTDFDAQWLIARVFRQGCAFWGSR